ncbi:MAG: sigma-70 family RNA polymerase sigma factor [Ferruginibacter sp.]
MEIKLSLHLTKNNFIYPALSNNKYNHITDAELLQRFYADHNNEWLGIILERYTMLLLGVSMKYLKNEEEAKDAVQQVFLKAINELHKYKVEYFKSWIYMIAKNHCLMKLRDKGRFSVEINERSLTTAAEPEEKNTYIEKDQTLDKLAGALQQLNKEQQLCVTLFYLDKKSYQEITEQTSYSLMQVKSHIQNGKRNLKIIMERMTGE